MRQAPAEALPFAQHAVDVLAGAGPAPACSAPALEVLAIALHANNRAADALKTYRRAAQAVRGDTRYRGYLLILLQNIVRMSGAPLLLLHERLPVPEQEESARLAAELAHEDPTFDRYRFVRGYVGDLPSKWYFGPHAGAAWLNFLAESYGVYDMVFEEQLYERHAFDLLDGVSVLNPLVVDVSSALLRDSGEIARQWNDERLMAANLHQRREFVEQLRRAGAKRLDIDLACKDLAVVAFEFFGDAAACEPNTGLATRLSKSDRWAGADLRRIDALGHALQGQHNEARKELEQLRADPALEGAGGLYKVDIAGILIADGAGQQARSLLGSPAEYDKLDPYTGAQVRRLLAAVAVETGDTASTVDLVSQAFDVIAHTNDGRSQFELGRSALWEGANVIRNAAITWALRHPGKPELAHLAATISIASRQLDIRRFKEDEAAWNHLEIGRDVLRHRHVVAWATAARLLQNLPSDIDPGVLPWEAIHRQMDEIDATNDELRHQRLTFGVDKWCDYLTVNQSTWTKAKSPLLLFVVYQPYDPMRDAFDLGGRFGWATLRVARAWIAPGQEPEWEDVGPVSDIDRRTNTFQQIVRTTDLRQDGPEKLEAAITAFRKLVFGSHVAAALQAQRLLIVPDGAIEYAPLAAALSNPAGQQSPVLRWVEQPEDLAEPEPPAANDIVVMAGHDLAEAGTELTEIGKLFKTTAVPTGHFDDVHHPALLHVASHGIFLSAPGEKRQDAYRRREVPLIASSPMLASRLRWSQQPQQDAVDTNLASPQDLTAFELAQSDLHGTGLAVLAACESGIGNAVAGEGVFGLRRALAIAGARRSLTTLWEVNDAATRALMTAFYRALSKGASADEALRRAQDAVRDTAGWESPFYWAGFVIAGAAGSPVPRNAQTNFKPITAAPDRLKFDLHALSHALSAESTSAPTLAGDRIFVAVAGDRLEALDARTGARLWSMSTRGKVDNAPAVSMDMVVVGDKDGVAAWSTSNGKPLWSINLGSKASMPTIADGQVYVTTMDDRAVAIGAGGTVIWSTHLDTYQQAHPKGESMSMGGAKPEVVGDAVYASDFMGRIARLDRKSGHVIWLTHVDAGVPELHVDNGEAMYASLWSGELVRLIPETGQVRWQHSSNDHAFALSVVWRGTELIYGTSGSTLFAIGASDGNLAWQLYVGNRVRPLAQVASTLVLVEDDGVRTIERISGTQTRLPAGTALAPYRNSSPSGNSAIFIAKDGRIFRLDWK